jgi:hypothetical protein
VGIAHHYIAFCYSANLREKIVTLVLRRTNNMDVKLIMVVLTGLFIVSSLFFGTKNGFYDTDKYDGNGTAH